MSVDNIILMSVDDLNPAAYNPRHMSDEEMEKLKISIEEYGIVQPIIWNKRTENVVGGHQRLKAAIDLGFDAVPVQVVDLDEKREKALNLNLNKISGDWVPSMLKDILEELDDGGFDMSLTGFDDFEIENLMTQYHVDEEDIEDRDVNEDEFNVAESLENIKEPRTQPGDVWQLGDHRLLCGDSTDPEVIAALMNGSRAEMIFTDPPYGMKLDTDYSGMSGNGRKGKTYEKVIGDHEDFKPELITTVFENFGYCKEIFLWGVDYYFDLIPGFKDGSLIVWDKTLESNGDAGYNSEFELVWSKTPHKKEVIHFNWFRFFGLSSQDIKTRVHPTQKPLQVISPFLKRHSSAGDLIVDLYGGSGSTLIACEQLGRRCFLIELDPKYCDVIIDRWETYTGEKAVKQYGRAQNEINAAAN